MAENENEVKTPADAVKTQADIGTKRIELGDTVRVADKPAPPTVADQPPVLTGVLSAAPAVVDTRKHVVLIVHGIRDVAAWANSIKKAFEGTANEAVVTGTDPINLIDFVVLSKRARRIRVEWLRSQIAQYDPREYRVSIIAHSFGTFVVGALLKQHPEVRLERLILCGAILPRQFEWIQLFKRNISPHHVLSDCGVKDPWPLIARTLIWCGYDASGTFGFTQYGVRDRFHDFGHSGFLNEEFAAKYWLPWITTGEYVKSAFDENRPSPGRIQNFVNNYARWAFPFLILLLLGMATYYYRGNLRNTYSTVFNSRLPASALSKRLDVTLQPWTALQEQVTNEDDDYEKTRKRLNKWHGYMAEGAQPWLAQSPQTKSIAMAWGEAQIATRDVGDVVGYSCHVNPRYRIVEMYAFLKSDNGEDGTYSPVYRQQTPTIKDEVCNLDVDYPRSDEKLMIHLLVTTTDGSSIDGDPNTWGFYLQRR